MSETNNYLIDEKIDEDKHFRPIGDFKCYENESLEIFLKCSAIRYHQESQGTTYIVWDGDEILAFYTLKCNAVQMEEDNEIISMPSIEIARLAVKTGLQGIGWGTAIYINYILPKIVEVKKLLAVKFIMVFVEEKAEDETDTNSNNDKRKDPIKFYKKFGFEPAREEVQNCIEETYSEGCKIMLLSLDKAEEIAKELENTEENILNETGTEA